MDGAAQVIRPMLDLEPMYRNNGIIVSAQRVRQALATSRARTAVVARDLREEISVYPPRRSSFPTSPRR
ncbi:hypothetical protein [Streptomyces sp. NBC_01092]|uniref:hypothetical protein n=1 Tax=Streptomyces sp. NBC_01092 TaxID=2903748 RepID=UPI003868F139|nr:hypothetical protein OG254_26215 [Streptomyces sp. NBC_01092]